MRHRRRRGEGTVFERKDGKFEAAAYVSTPQGIKRVSRYATTRSEAEELLVALRKKNASGLITNTKEQKLGDYLDYWLLLSKKRLAPGTFISYETTVRKYLKPGLGHKSLTKLKVSDVQNHLDNQQSLGESIRSIHKQKIVLSAALKRANQDELLDRNVARLVVIPQYRPKEVVPWDLSQLKIFLEYVRDDTLYPVFMLMSLYGLRTSEVLGLSWGDIDPIKNVIHVRRQLQCYEKFHYAELKTQAGRRDLPISDNIYKLLAEIPCINTGPLPDLIFKTRNGTPIYRRNLLRSFKRLSANAGLPKSTLHSLRHSAATNLKDIGISPRDTQIILGHANISTTMQIYQHSGIEQRHSAIQQYEQKIVEISASSCQIKPSSSTNTIELTKINSGISGWVLSSDLRLMSPAL